MSGQQRSASSGSALEWCRYLSCRLEILKFKLGGTCLGDSRCSGSVRSGYVYDCFYCVKLAQMTLLSGHLKVYKIYPRLEEFLLAEFLTLSRQTYSCCSQMFFLCAFTRGLTLLLLIITHASLFLYLDFWFDIWCLADLSCEQTCQ